MVRPAAGGGRGGRYGASVARILAEGGVDVRLVQAADEAGTARTARQAVEDGARAVVASGGDGTVHTVLQEVVGSGTPLGIAAAGSGDDIASGLGLVCGSPEQIGASLLRALQSGSDRCVDVGVIQADGSGHRYFLGVMSTGFDSSVNERANGMGRLAGQRYNVAIMRELASFRPLEYEVEMDGTTVRGSGMLVSVGNGPQYGGGMRLCPDADSADGLLDITWLDPVPVHRFLRLFPSVYRGDHVRHPAVRTFRAERIRISAQGQIAYADGERVGPLPVEVSLRPLALRVLTEGPAPAP